MSGVLFSCSYDKFTKKQIVSSYKGKIIEKYEKHGTHLKIDTDSLGEIDIGGISGDLIQNASVGDSIIKVKNLNVCILKRSNSVIKLKYIFY